VLIQNVFLVLFGVWLITLSVLFYWLFRHYADLTKDVSGKNLKQILDKILSAEERNAVNIRELQKNIKKIYENEKFFIQKIGIVRFNPFKETGGDHSFCLAILDGKNDGFVITGLHTRERTRIYVKEIKKGILDSGLSDEEKKTIIKALRSKV